MTIVPIAQSPIVICQVTIVHISNHGRQMHSNFALEPIGLDVEADSFRSFRFSLFHVSYIQVRHRFKYQGSRSL
jgi:hypothetical protein